MEYSVLDAPVQGTRELRYAGFWIRVAAYIIDYIVITIAYYIIIAILGVLGFSFLDQETLQGRMMSEPSALIGFLVGLYAIIFVITIAYYCGMESSSNQGTLGKMAVGIKIGKADGSRISFGNAVGRYFAKILSGIILCIGYIMVGFDEKKQGLHDKLANTIVFYK